MSAAKKGIWTEHVDAASGRTYYFNVVHGRSYWELPESLKAVVMRPLNAAVTEAEATGDEAAAEQAHLSHEDHTSSVASSGASVVPNPVDPNAEDSFSSRIQLAMKHQEELRRRQHHEGSGQSHS